MKKSECKYSFLEVKQKIEAWCAYRDRCHSEVITKLFDFGLDQEDVNALLSQLIQDRFVDEQRFADAFVSGKYRIKKWGRNKIINHLKQKQVPTNCIDSAIKTIDESLYWDNLISLTQKKWKEKSGDQYSKIQKVKRFLYQKGYEYNLIEEAIDKVGNEF